MSTHAGALFGSVEVILFANRTAALVSPSRIAASAWAMRSFGELSFSVPASLPASDAEPEPALDAEPEPALDAEPEPALVCW